MEDYENLLLSVVEKIDEKIGKEVHPQKLQMLKNNFEDALSLYRKAGMVDYGLVNAPRLYLESYSDYLNNPLLEEMGKLEKYVKSFMANKEEILQAIGNGRLKQVLKGECGYSIGFDEWSAALVPTDWTQVLPLLNVYARQVGSTYVEHYFENTIIELLSGDAEDIFVAIGAFYTQLLFERDGDFTYSIQREKIASIAKTSIAQNQENLQTCKSWYGAYSDNGLMDEINRYRKLMKKNFNLDLGNIESTHSVEIFTELSKKILRGAKIPHSTSQPVIYEENGRYYLAVFVFFFTQQDIEAGMVDRPTHWALADIETGEIVNEYDTKDKDFSDAPYVKYNVRSDGKYDTSKEYYDKAFAVLDSVREKLLKEGHLYMAEYDYYLNMILKNIPKDYQRFFRDLSV